MTPELAEQILARPTNAELQTLVDHIYREYTSREIADCIANIRARLTLENHPLDIDR